MSMRLLAKEVGVTEGALYRHFQSKDEIVQDLLTQEASRFHDALASRLPESPESASTPRDPWAELDALVAAFIDYGRKEAESFRLIMEIHGSPGSTLQPRGRKPRTLFVGTISRINARTPDRKSDPTATVVMIVGLLSRLIVAERTKDLKLGPAQVVLLAQRSARAVVDAAWIPSAL